MSFEEFQHHARLYVLGALDEEEMVAFEEGRRAFGAAAETFLDECRQLNSAFALSLRPQAPRADAKERLMAMVRESLRQTRQVSSQKV
jgi:hypothetical protein